MASKRTWTPEAARRLRCAAAAQGRTLRDLERELRAPVRAWATMARRPCLKQVADLEGELGLPAGFLLEGEGAAP